ncbi:hypothetical protein LCGC14_0795700 [marine sediment metagenome]|uniref:Uncharacterized protein n=1 Tax=marine sediment metagenome TaxID=412755 RepID=A0A0F9SB42_9ZZZZ
MGITIHYNFKFNGSGKELLAKLELIYKEIKLMDIVEISKVEVHNKAMDCDINWKKNRGVGFEVNVMEGSEWFTVILFNRGIESWSSHEFTKTEYANDFMKCHKMVCSMLKVCEKHGILESVHDEAGYWDSMNDEVLIENKAQSEEDLEFLGQMLKGSGFNVVTGHNNSDKKKKPDHIIKSV